MDHYPSADEVFNGLGDKVAFGLGDIVEGARLDYARYRETLPHVVSRHSARGLANWIHDAMWARALAVFDENPDVTFVDDEPTRDIYIRDEYRLRLKRHSKTGAIQSYPTAAAIDFISQDEDLFAELGSPILNLCAGYEWDRFTRSIGAAVLSLHDGSFKEPLWMVALPFSGTVPVTPVIPITPHDGGPATPVIEVPKVDAARENNEGSEAE
jgi:hypothetical protein